MKRSILGLLGATALLLAPLAARPAHAQLNNGSGIIGSSHDFQTGSAMATRVPAIGGTSNQVCIYCHTPHGARTASVPLWNRSLDTVRTFTMYSSPTIHNTFVANGPGAVSRACLACHDGVGAISNFGATTTATDKITAADMIMGTNLSDDHPVGLVVGTADPNIVAVATIKNTLPLFGAGANQLECSSCHEAHDKGAAVRYMLRVNNAGSALCFTCHIK